MTSSKSTPRGAQGARDCSTTQTAWKTRGDWIFTSCVDQGANVSADSGGLWVWRTILMRVGRAILMRVGQSDLDARRASDLDARRASDLHDSSLQRIHYSKAPSGEQLL
eukprot:scaffold101_cov230-Pinguiococcus_pyrenoidosus.AAC.8